MGDVPLQEKELGRAGRSHTAEEEEDQSLE